MKKISKNKRELFENNCDDLRILFQKLVLTLSNCELFYIDGNNYILKNNSLEIKFSQIFLQEKKIMVLCILNKWDNYFEELIIEDSYSDLKSWFVEEVLNYCSMLNNTAKTCINNIRKIKKTNNDKPIYKDYSFAMDLNNMQYEIEYSKIEYKTDSIGRGLKSFCTLDKNYLINKQSSIIARIFSEMICDEFVSKKLKLKFNSSLTNKKQIDFIRKAGLNFDNLFSKNFTFNKYLDSFYIWHGIETEIINLCMYYAKIEN